MTALFIPPAPRGALPLMESAPVYGRDESRPDLPHQQASGFEFFCCRLQQSCNIFFSRAAPGAACMEE